MPVRDLDLTAACDSTWETFKIAQVGRLLVVERQLGLKERPRRRLHELPLADVGVQGLNGHFAASARYRSMVGHPDGEQRSRVTQCVWRHLYRTRPDMLHMASDARVHQREHSSQVVCDLRR
eukprot:8498041-Pyramimonas_sp.AAC.1